MQVFFSRLHFSSLFKLNRNKLNNKSFPLKYVETVKSERKKVKLTCFIRFILSYHITIHNYSNLWVCDIKITRNSQQIKSHMHLLLLVYLLQSTLSPTSLILITSNILYTNLKLIGTITVMTLFVLLWFRLIDKTAPG